MVSLPLKMGCLKLHTEENFTPLKIAYSKADKGSEKVVQWCLSVDPLAHVAPGWSPYRAFYCNPIIYTDPTGMLESPIYDVSGNLMGTDDQGLTGDALVLNASDFKQGMSHKEAVDKDLGQISLNDSKARDNFKTSYSSLPSRPDYDGKLTLNEANEWYRTGGGKPLFVDASKVDLTPVYKGDLTTGKMEPVNFASPKYANLETGLVYGTVYLTQLNAEGVVKLGISGNLMDKYDFDYQKGRTGRNAATWLGKQVAGEGTGYNIFNYGTGLLLQRPAPIKIERGPKY